MTESNKSNLVFIVIVAAVSTGIALRLNGIFMTGIWYDESLPFAAARLPFWPMLEATKYTYAPPLWDLIVWCSVRILGQNEAALRLPSLIASVFTLWLVNKISGEFLLNDLQKAALMVFICILPYQIWTAQDGRIYAILSALYLGAAWFALRGRWLGLTACSGLILYSHYAGPFYILGLYAAAALTAGRSFKNIKALIVSGLAAVLLFIPWAPVYIATLAEKFTVAPLSAFDLSIMFYRITFAGTLGQSALLVFGVYTVVGSLSVSALVMIVQIFKILKHKSFSVSQDGINAGARYIQLSLIALFPLLTMVIWSVVWRNFVYYRLLIPLAIPLTLWALFTLTSYTPAWTAKYIFIPIWLVLLVAGVANWSPNSRDGNLHHAIDMINMQWQPGDIIYHITGTTYMPFSNYVGNKPMYLIDEQQHGWLLQIPLQDMFGIKRSALEDIFYKRVWIIDTPDGYVSDSARRRADQYIKNGVLIDVVQAWQFSPMKIYLVGNKP